MDTLRLLAIWGAAIICSPSHAAPPIPTEAFARIPQVQSVTLSPSGKWFAAIDNRTANATVITHSTDGAEPARAVFKNDTPDYTLSWVRWVSDDRLLISVRFPDRRGNTDTTESRLVAVDRDGGHPRTLLQPAGFNAGTLQLQDEIVDWLPGDGHHVLLQGRAQGVGAAVAVYRVDIDSGEREIVHGARFGVQQWMADGSHRIRIGRRQLGTKVEILVSDLAGDNWRTAWSYELFSPMAVVPLGFGADPNILYVTADHEGHRAVHSVDLRDPALALRLVLSFKQHDVSGSLILDPLSGNAVGVRGVGVGVGVGNAKANFWDADMQQLAEAIDAGLPGRFNRLLQFNADGSRYLIFSSGNGIPGRFLIGDRSKRTVAVLARQYPELPSEGLARKSEFILTARDGLKVPVLLTLPAGSEAHGLPAVILPHGGPIGQDSLDFDPLAEFIAARGYAVLQVNFRGSAGLGDEFRNAGLQRWGLEMQDDISDATRWLTERGTADPARVCIVGGSYGGYAALMGGAKTPELYRCVVSLAGVSDLAGLGESRAHYVNGGAVFDRQVGGSTAEDRQRLKDTSPRWLASRFKVPVLLIHGTADRSVPYEQSEQMAQALTDAGKSVRFVTLEDGDHQLTHAGNRLLFYQELESFLNAQIGAARGATDTKP